MISILLVSGLVLSALGCTATPKRESNGTPTTELNMSAEEYRVLSALIDQLYARTGIDSVILEDKTETFSFAKRDLDETLTVVAAKVPGGVPREMIDDFKEKNARNSHLTDLFETRIKREFMTEEDMNHLYRDGWGKFLEEHPGREIISFSRVGFIKDRKLALVYTGSQSGGKSGAGYYVVLMADGNAWKIRDKIEVWIS